MQKKFFILLAVTVIGFAAAIVLPFKYAAQTHAPAISPQAGLFEGFRGELNGIASGNLAVPPPARAIEAASSTSSSSAAQKIAWNCTGINTANFDCYRKYYTNVVNQEGVKAAFDDLKARYPGDSYAQSQCHPLSHVIGRAASAKFATPGEAYKYGDSFCWSGYYHGVLEGIVGRIGLKNLPTQLNTICADIRNNEGYGFNYYNCVHGLGHGIMSVTDDELLESLAMCDNLTGSWEQQSCASGAYMENIIADGTLHITKFLNPNDPLYPCDSSPEKYKNTCYLMQTSYMLKINGRDFKATFASCSKVEDAYRNTCYQSLGRDASGQSLSIVAPTTAICLLGTDVDQRTNCVIGAVKDFISYFHSDAQAKELCGSFDDKSIQQTCLSTAASYYSQF